MDKYLIQDNIEGVPFILIQKKDLQKWNGFYLSYEKSKNISQSVDLEADGKKYIIFESDDFDNPLTDWGFVIGKDLEGCNSPLIINIRDYQVVLIDPCYYTAWESYNVLVVKKDEAYYFVLFTLNISEIDENLFDNLKEKFELVNSVKWSVEDKIVRIFPTTEHGRDKDVTVYKDINLVPANYKIDLYLSHCEFHQIAVYKMSIDYE